MAWEIPCTCAHQIANDLVITATAKSPHSRSRRVCDQPWWLTKTGKWENHNDVCLLLILHQSGSKSCEKWIQWWRSGLSEPQTRPQSTKAFPFSIRRMVADIDNFLKDRIWSKCMSSSTLSTVVCQWSGHFCYSCSWTWRQWGVSVTQSLLFLPCKAAQLKRVTQKRANSVVIRKLSRGHWHLAGTSCPAFIELWGGNECHRQILLVTSRRVL